MSTEPERTCIITREAQPKQGLLRFVLSPEGLLVADLAHKLPGRGVYVTCSQLLVAEAIAKRAFSRALKEQVQIPDGFLEKITELMRKRTLEALSIARKSGLLVTGFEKVEEALKSGQVTALLHAQDAGDDGVKKLKYFDVPAYQFFSREALCQVLDRENAVHVAVLEGAGAQFFLSEARRFALFIE